MSVSSEALTQDGWIESVDSPRRKSPQSRAETEADESKDISSGPADDRESWMEPGAKQRLQFSS